MEWDVTQIFFEGNEILQSRMDKNSFMYSFYFHLKYIGNIKECEIYIYIHQ